MISDLKTPPQVPRTCGVSIQENKGINLADIMYRFALWLTKGEYTPFGEAFDNGGCTTDAILSYLKKPDVTTCGGTNERDNGNGSGERRCGDN